MLLGTLNLKLHVPSTAPMHLPLTMFRMKERGKKFPFTSLFSVTSTNVGISSRNFLIFSFNTFFTLVQNFKAIPSARPKLLNLKVEHSSKKVFFSGQILIKRRL